MVIYRSRYLLALNKPAGLPTQTREQKDLQRLGNSYAKQKLFLLHRIDQPVSGVVLFGRERKIASQMSALFAAAEVRRRYLAVVRSRPALEEGELTLHLTRDKRLNKTFVTTDNQVGKESALTYRYLHSSQHYHLLEINLTTGRHHQIRAMLAHIGTPIKGDVKYGDRRSNRDRSIHLHAHQLTFLHPKTNTAMTVTAPLPQERLWQYFNNQI